MDENIASKLEGHDLTKPCIELGIQPDGKHFTVSLKATLMPEKLARHLQEHVMQAVEEFTECVGATGRFTALGSKEPGGELEILQQGAFDHDGFQMNKPIDPKKVN